MKKNKTGSSLRVSYTHGPGVKLFWTRWLWLRTGTGSILVDAITSHYWPDERHPDKITPVIQKLGRFEDLPTSLFPLSAWTLQANDE